MVTVVLPFRGGCPHRERALRWVLDRYRERHPDWTVKVAEAPPGPWVKALAVTPAVATVETDLVLVADADAWSDGLEQAVEAVAEGAPWAMPHLYVHRLTEQSTAAVLEGADPRGLELDEPAYPGTEAGGVLVARRDLLLDVPLDPRFIGWGQEDISQAMALLYLAGPCSRGAETLYHLWHPPQQRINRRYSNDASWRLYRRYGRARRDPRDMRALIEEAKAHGASEPHQQAVHAHAP